MFSALDSSNETFLKEFIKDVPTSGKILLCFFASRENNNDALVTDLITQECVKESKDEVSIEIATKKEFIEQVSEANAIYLHGGSTDKLMKALEDYPDLKSALTNKPKTIAGSSAGAYALSTFYSSHYEDAVSEGLGIVPARVITHYDSKKMPPQTGAVQALKETRDDLELITLDEGAWATIEV